MALLTGMTRQADVVAMTYCRLLVLRKVDFDHFMDDNRDIRLIIHTIAASRSSMNRSDQTKAGLCLSLKSPGGGSGLAAVRRPWR